MALKSDIAKSRKVYFAYNRLKFKNTKLIQNT